jgi:hypothetical protein
MQETQLPSQPSLDARSKDILRQPAGVRALPHAGPRDRLARTLLQRRPRGTAMFARTAIAASLLQLAIPAWAQSQALPPIYSEQTPIETLAADPAAAAILNKDLPGLLTDSQYPIFKGMSLKAIQGASNGDLSKTDVEKTVADLQALPRR